MSEIVVYFCRPHLTYLCCGELGQSQVEVQLDMNSRGMKNDTSTNHLYRNWNANSISEPLFVIFLCIELEVKVLLQGSSFFFLFLILIRILKSFHIRHAVGYYFSNRTRHAYEWVRMIEARKTKQEIQREDKWRWWQGEQLCTCTTLNFARAPRYFAHFFAVVAPLRHETS